MRKMIALFLAALLTLPCLFGCAGSEEEAPELLEPVRGRQDTGTVLRGDLEKTDVYPGIMTPKVVQVYMEGSGTIENFVAWSGKKVKKGEPLIELNREKLEEEIESLKEELENLAALGEYDDRLSDIDIQKKSHQLSHLNNLGLEYRIRALKQLEVDEAVLRKKQNAETRELQKTALEERLAALEKDLENLVITAPCSGYVYIDESLANGSYLMEGKPILKILDDENLIFRTSEYVPETNLKEEYYGWIEGERYELEYIPMPQQDMLALIAAGETIYSDFTVKDGKDLTAGAAGAAVTITRKTPDVLYVPTNALSYDSGGLYLIMDAKDGTEKRYVTTGFGNGVYTAIRSGVSEGEVFYVQK